MYVVDGSSNTSLDVKYIESGRKSIGSLRVPSAIESAKGLPITTMRGTTVNGYEFHFTLALTETYPGHEATWHHVIALCPEYHVVAVLHSTVRMIKTPQFRVMTVSYPFLLILKSCMQVIMFISLPSLVGSP